MKVLLLTIYLNCKAKQVPKGSVDQRLNTSHCSNNLQRTVLHCLHTPGHTPGGISPYLDVKGTRILFDQDIHGPGPFDPSWGSNKELWRDSMRKLINLNADILCEGHFGIYKPADKVRDYIEYYLDYHS